VTRAVPTIGQFVCPGTLLGIPGQPENDRRVTTPLPITNAYPDGRIEVDANVILNHYYTPVLSYYVLSGPPPQNSCSSPVSTAVAGMAGRPSLPGAGEASGAILTIVTEPSAPTWGHYWLLRGDPATAFRKAGIRIPPGMTAEDTMRTTCKSNFNLCTAIRQTLDTNAVSKVRGVATTTGILPPVAPGTYYLMVSAVCNSHLYIISQVVDLKPGPNSSTLDVAKQ